MELEIFTLPRVYIPTETLGSIYGPDGTMVCKSLELPWRNNAIGKTSDEASCVKEDTYIVEKQEPKPSRPYGYFRFRKVEGRTVNKYVLDMNGEPMSSILIHRITFVKDLLGCVGVGGKFADLNNDGVPDIVESSKTLQWMYENLPNVFKLHIFKK